MRLSSLSRLALLPFAAFALTGCGTEAEPPTPPQQLSESPFHYPEDLWDAGVEGETVLRLFVNAAGAVDTVQVEQGSGYEAFDSAAVTGARELRFEPAMQGDEPVSVWVLLPVRFDLPGAESDTAAVEP